MTTITVDKYQFSYIEHGQPSFGWIVTFAWYFSVSEFNAALSSGHIKNGGIVQPIMEFQTSLVIECLENTIGFGIEINWLTRIIFCKYFIPSLKSSCSKTLL